MTTLAGPKTSPVDVRPSARFYHLLAPHRNLNLQPRGRGSWGVARAPFPFVWQETTPAPRGVAGPCLTPGPVRAENSRGRAGRHSTRRVLAPARPPAPARRKNRARKTGGGPIPFLRPSTYSQAQPRTGERDGAAAPSPGGVRFVPKTLPPKSPGWAPRQLADELLRSRSGLADRRRKPTGSLFPAATKNQLVRHPLAPYPPLNNPAADPSRTSNPTRHISNANPCRRGAAHPPRPCRSRPVGDRGATTRPHHAKLARPWVPSSLLPQTQRRRLPPPRCGHEMNRPGQPDLPAGGPTNPAIVGVPPRGVRARPTFFPNVRTAPE